MDKEIIREKISYLKDILERLKIRVEDYKVEDDEKNIETLFLAISKLSEEIVETAIKINNIFLEEKGDYSSTDYGTFTKLSRHYSIDKKLLQDLAKTTSLRNKVTHEYQNFLNFRDISNFEPLFDLYMKYINSILKTIS